VDTNGYQIVHSQKFDKELKQITGTAPLGDELIRGISIIANRNPYTGVKFSDNIWCFDMANDNWGQIDVFYTIKETTKEVLLLSIQKFNK
jgi:hypothetical protein